MTKITAAYFGAVMLVVCLVSKQADSNTTATTYASTTANTATQLAQNGSSTAATTSTYISASSGNFTTPLGAGNALQSNTFSILLPLAASASIFRLRC